MPGRDALGTYAGITKEYMLLATVAEASCFEQLWDEMSPIESPHLIYGIRRVKETRY